MLCEMKTINEKQNIFSKIRYYTQRKSVKYGVPFLVLILGGSFGLKEFSQLRYQFSKNKSLKPEEVEKFGIHMKKPSEVTLESEYDKIKDLDIENWEQKRGPRPWEE